MCKRIIEYRFRRFSYSIGYVLKPLNFRFFKNDFSFDGTNFKAEASSKFSHVYVTALGNYRDSPFVTGGNLATYGLKTEILDYGARIWNQADDYPFSIGDRYVKFK